MPRLLFWWQQLMSNASEWCLSSSVLWSYKIFLKLAIVYSKTTALWKNISVITTTNIIWMKRRMWATTVGYQIKSGGNCFTGFHQMAPKSGQNAFLSPKHCSILVTSLDHFWNEMWIGVPVCTLVKSFRLSAEIRSSFILLGCLLSACSSSSTIRV